MIEHFRIFGAIITLSLGIFVGAKIYWVWKSFNISYMKWLLGYVICFNLGIGLLLTIKYLDLNLSNDLPQGLFSSIKLGGIMGGVLCIYGMTRFTLTITFNFLNKPLRFWIQSWLALGFIVFGASIIALLLISPTFQFPNLVQYAIVAITGSVFVLEFGSLTALLVNAKKHRSVTRIRIESTFAILFLSRYILYLSLAGMALIKNPDWLVPVAVYTVLVMINLFSLFWLFVVQKNFTSPALHENLSAILEKLGNKSSISNREYEVLRLILEGKSNKEIEAELFISQHTVKNHIYNLYQKLGINSRYQLIKLLYSHYAGPAYPDGNSG